MKTGARISIVVSSIGLGLFVSFIACIEQVAQALNNYLQITSSLITFPLILLGYFGVRFAGQGVLANSARNVLLVWFEKRRGLVVGARSVIITLGFSLAPPFLAFLIAYFGWRRRIIRLAVISGVIFSLIRAYFYQGYPRILRLLPDGYVTDDSDKPPAIPSRTLVQAKKSPVFWIYAAALGFLLFVWNGVHFSYCRDI